MANSFVDIEIVSPIQVGDSFSITDARINFNFDETFVQTRVSNNQVSDGFTTAGSTANLKNALNLDYGPNNVFTISNLSSSKIRLTATTTTIFGVASNNSGGRIDIDVTNIVPPPEFEIDSITFDEATVEDPCTHVKVIVETDNGTADKVTSPVIIDPNLVNPFDFEFPRQSFDTVTCQITSPFEQDSKTFTTPDVLSAGNVTPNIVESPSGATVTIIVTNANKLDLEYSLDDILYQDSNVFFGLFIGSHTVFVRDQFGCTVSVGFDVTSETPSLSVTDPFEFVSNQNSIRYAKKTPATTTSGLLELSETYKIENYVAGDDFTNVGASLNETGEEFFTTGQTPTNWTNGSALRKISPATCFDYQNSDTLLSCQEVVNQRVRYTELQKYHSCDLIKTQFKSNYDNIVVKIIDELGVESLPSLTKVTDNLEREDRRDATIIDLGDDKTGIFFTSGNTYDFFTGFINGSYTLNGNLPEFGVVGTFVDIEGEGIHLIVDITIDENINARILVFDFDYGGSTQVIQVKSQYSVANFEVYEFNVDMSFFINQNICVSIHMDHPLVNFPDVDYISELIDVKILHTVEPPDQLLEIEYFNTQNGEILYIDEEGNQRIKHKIRKEARSVTISSKSDSEVLNTDTTSILLDATIYQGDEFVFSPIPTEMARRLRNALSHNVVNINGVGYVLEDEVPEIERLGESNLYTVTAKMLRTGKIFNTDIQGVGNEVPEVSEVTKLLTGELGFVKTG